MSGKKFKSIHLQKEHPAGWQAPGLINARLQFAMNGIKISSPEVR